MMKCERGRVKCDVCWCLLFLMNFLFSAAPGGGSTGPIRGKVLAFVLFVWFPQ